MKKSKRRRGGLGFDCSFDMAWPFHVAHAPLATFMSYFLRLPDVERSCHVVQF